MSSTHPMPPSLRQRWRDLGLASARLASASVASRRAGAASGPLGVASPMHNNGRNDGPPDLDELWRDFNRKLSGLFGGKGGGGNAPRGNGGNGGPGFQPDMRSAGIGVGLIAAVVTLIWLGSGFSSCRKASKRW